MSLSPAEQLLQELGVTHPNEIDVEAIAWYCGVQVRYRELDGCEARIVGDRHRAIISVRPNVSLGRKRFSIGHELGHWQYHRGRTLICRPQDIGPESQGKHAIEKLADSYAADLLMPAYLFRAEAQKAKTLTWELIRSLAELFSCSITAAAIRVIDLDVFPALLVCHGVAGRRWFVRSKSIPERWFPQGELSADSYAIDVLYGQRIGHSPRLCPATLWFDSREASHYEVYEQSIQLLPNEVLTLLVPKSAEMLEEVDTERSWRRRR